MSKEIKECAKEMNGLYDEFYKRFCEGTSCTECLLDVLYGECMLCILQDSIEILKEKQQ